MKRHMSSLIVKLKVPFPGPAIREVAIPGKGRGLGAVRLIAKGTCVLTERPIFSVSHPIEFVDNILATASTLDSRGRQLLQELHRYACREDRAQAEQRLGVNWQALPEDTKHTLEAYWANSIEGHVFANASLLNHSCEPNLHFSWNPNSGQGRFHAIVDIKADEELTISYIDSGYWTTYFRQDLLKKYGFTCTCKCCLGALDARLTEEESKFLCRSADDLQEHEGTDFEDWQKSKAVVREMLATLHYIPNKNSRKLCRIAARYSWRLGQLEKTAHYAKVNLELEQFCMGLDHPTTLRTQDVLIRIEEALRDQQSYHIAKDQRSLDELRQLIKPGLPVDQWNAKKQSKAKSDIPVRDWRLYNIEKACIWARMDMKAEAREHPDPQHVAVQRLAEDVNFLMDTRDALRSGLPKPIHVYEEIMSWLDEVDGVELNRYDVTELRAMEEA